MTCENCERLRAALESIASDGCMPEECPGCDGDCRNIARAALESTHRTTPKEPPIGLRGSTDKPTATPYTVAGLGMEASHRTTPPTRATEPECVWKEDASEPGDCFNCGGGFNAPIHQLVLSADGPCAPGNPCLTHGCDSQSCHCDDTLRRYRTPPCAFRVAPPPTPEKEPGE